MTFVPPRSAVASITQASPGVVTTVMPHGLTSGQVVRMHVPMNYGMYQINQLALSVIVTDPVTFQMYYTLYPNAIPVDTTILPAFTVPTNPGFTAEVLSIGVGQTPQVATEWQRTNQTFDDPLIDATYNNSTVAIPFEGT